MTMRVAGLYIYPLKSARGIELDRSEAGPEGLAWDRRWMVVDAHGHFVTQRGNPSMSQLGVALDRAAGAITVTIPRAPGVALSGEAGERSVTIPGASAVQGSERFTVEIWGEHVPAIAPSPDADRLLSDYLGQSVRVVVFPDDVVRACDPRYAAPGDRVGFADGFPYLVTTTASLDAVSAEVGRAMAVARFRPNIVVETVTPWDEDLWLSFSVGGLKARVVKPCGRCVMVNVDPDSGATSREPLRTLTRSRRIGSRVVFGQNVVFDTFGPIAVGDVVTLRSRVMQ